MESKYWEWQSLPSLDHWTSTHFELPTYFWTVKWQRNIHRIFWLQQLSIYLCRVSTANVWSTMTFSPFSAPNRSVPDSGCSIGRRTTVGKPPTIPGDTWSVSTKRAIVVVILAVAVWRKFLLLQHHLTYPDQYILAERRCSKIFPWITWDQRTTFIA